MPSGDEVMPGWLEQLTYDPIETLLNAKWEAIKYFTRRDLLGENVGPIEALWELREPETAEGAAG